MEGERENERERVGDWGREEGGEEKKRSKTNASELNAP